MRAFIRNYKWTLLYLSGMFMLCLLALGLYQFLLERGDKPPSFAMIRLEDIGPGGYYDSLEGLGKLRAVLEFLHQEHIHYSMAVIPRWINILPDGTRYDRSLDQTGSSYIQSLDKLLHQAVADGATLGMHGYTHQVGSIRRTDGHQASGIGNEFNEPDMPETSTKSFAEERVKAGLRIFHHAGLAPEFWEAPHYHTTTDQDQVFRAYFGLQYEPDAAINPNTSAAQYLTGLNQGYGAATLGTVYVPTPLSYIPENKDEKAILQQLGKWNRMNSFFYHPFLEFQYLIPVVDDAGKPVMRDGLPEYKYPDTNTSMLQKLVTQIKSKGYLFYSIHDYVPFTPSQRVEVGEGNENDIQIGDVTGKGQSDVLIWNKKSGNINVVEGYFKDMRNGIQPVPKVWATVPYTDGSAFTINDTNGDGKKGLWVVHPDGRLESYTSTGTAFTLNQVWNIPPGQWLEAQELHQPNGDCVLAGHSKDRSQLLGVYLHQGMAEPITPYTFTSPSTKDWAVKEVSPKGTQGLFMSKKDTSDGLQIEFDPAVKQWKATEVHLNIPARSGQIRFGDFNGDGKEDILRWNAADLTYTEYLQTADDEYTLLSTFGPWGKRNGRLIIADFDGNGRKDLGQTTNEDPYLDVALSYQSKEH